MIDLAFSHRRRRENCDPGLVRDQKDHKYVRFSSVEICTSVMGQKKQKAMFEHAHDVKEPIGRDNAHLNLSTCQRSALELLTRPVQESIA